MSHLRFGFFRIGMNLVIEIHARNRVEGA